MGFNYFTAEAALNRAVAGSAPNPIMPVVGNILNKSIGGAVLGAGGNMAVYGNSGQSVDGAYSYGEAAVSGALAGGIAGVALGVAGAKSAFATARAKRTVSDKRIAKAADRVINKKYDTIGPDGKVEKWAVKDDAEFHNNRIAGWQKVENPPASAEELTNESNRLMQGTYGDIDTVIKGLNKQSSAALKSRYQTGHLTNPLRPVSTA